MSASYDDCDKSGDGREFETTVLVNVEDIHEACEEMFHMIDLLAMRLRDVTDGRVSRKQAIRDALFGARRRLNPLLTRASFDSDRPGRTRRR